MELALNQEQTSFAQTVRRWAAERLASEALNRERAHAWPADLWREAVDLGLLAILVPEAHGGMGCTLLDLCLVLQEVGHADASLALAIGLQNLAAAALVGIPGHEGRAEAIAGGEFFVGWAFHAVPSATTAYQVGVIPAASADAPWLVLHPSREPMVSLASVGASLPPAPMMALDNLHWVAPSATAFGAGSPVPSGSAVLAQVLIVAAAIESAVAEQACVEMSRYALERQQFGQAIATYQDIQWMIADSVVSQQASYWAVLACASAPPATASALVRAIQAKLLADRAASMCTAKAFQVHGGYGYTKEYPIERLFREAQVLATLPWTGPVLKACWGQALLA